MLIYFNPRSREGSDELLRIITTSFWGFQSTLPRRERRKPDSVIDFFLHDFNPRSREGSDVNIAIKSPLYSDFNPRSREGSDILPVICGKEQLNFNPRSREGSDAKQNSKLLDLMKFQSTLPRRERLLSEHGSTETTNFNPRSREGSDTTGSLAHILKRISIHAPAKGATADAFNEAVSGIFQSTLPRRERPRRS